MSLLSKDSKTKKGEDQKVNVFITPHYHYDYEWCDTPDGMGAKTAKIIKHALLIMRKYPDYKYAIDSVMSVEYFKLHHPDMMEELKKRVQEGRVELMGGMIIAPDTMMPNGESLVRQVLYGSQYFKENFGVESKVGYLLDSFGQTPQLPQILKKVGFEYHIFWRVASNRELPSEFIWKALDGTKILVHWLYGSYTWITLPFTPTILPPVFPFFPIPATLNIIPQNFRVYEILKKLFPPIKYIVQKLNSLNAGVSILGSDMGAGLPYVVKNRLTRSTTNNVFILNGTDNIPPSSNIVDAVRYLQKKSKKYNFKIATPSEFLTSVINNREKFGVIEAYEFSGAPYKFPGTYSVRIQLKQKIRELENQFYLTELISALSNLYTGNKYDKDTITTAIKRILCCDFHDGICGCHIDAVYTHLMKMLKLSEMQLKRLFNEALNSFTMNIDTSVVPKDSIPFLIFNPLSIQRTESSIFTVPEEFGPFKIKDIDGNDIPFQKNEIEPSSDGYILKVSDLPSIGYKTFYAEKTENPYDPKLTSPNSLNFTCQDNLTEIKSERFTLTFEDNKLRTITDIKNNFTFKASNYFINDLRILNDRGDSYVHGKIPKKIFTTYENDLEVVENGPVRIVIKITSKLQCKNKWFFKPINLISQYIILYNFNIPRIDFITKFENKIRNCRIQACFPINLKNPIFHSEVPYGYIERDTKPRIGKSWEDTKKKFKKFAYYDRIFPVINWMDASSKKEKIGVTIINNGLPEYEIGENKDYIYLTLLKSTGNVGTIFPGQVPMVLGPFYNIPKAYELTDQEFHYSIFFHDGDNISNNITTEALRHNIPLMMKQMNIHSGDFSNSEEFISVEPDNFIINVVKKAENNEEEMIIRILECSGKESSGKIKILSDIKEVKLVNLLEIPIKVLEIENSNSFSFKSNPQEILTFSIKLKKK
jgi:alpha-mannosidase